MRRTVVAFTALALAGCAGHSGTAPSTAPSGAAPAAAVAAPPADPTMIQYAGGTHRYRIMTEQHTAQEMMGQTQTVDATTSQVLSITLASRGDSLTMRATMDSMTVSTTVPGADSAAAVASRGVIGRPVTGMMTARGHVAAVQAVDTGMVMAQVVNGVRDFFLELPSGPLTPGREWTDTVNNQQAMGPINLTTRSIRAHHIVGWETKDSTRALHVTTVSNYTVSGTGEAQGQPLDLSGSGRVTLERWVTGRGVYLGATEADSADMNVNVTSMGMSIPVRRTQRATVTRLP